MPFVTVLYEDSKIGREYPLHQLVLRMVEDDLNGETWKLRKIVLGNPRNGIDKVLGDLRAASLIAGEGQLLVLVDRDRLIRHINQNAREGEVPVSPTADDAEIAAVVRARSDAPDKVQVFLLRPNVEGLIRSIASCAPGHWADDVAKARAKDRIARDVVLMEVAKAAAGALRACIREGQPGLDALVRALGQAIPAEAIGKT